MERKTVAIRMRVNRAKRFHRMIDAAHSGRKPEPLRRIECSFRVENDGPRANVRTDERVLLADALVGNTGQVGKFSSGQGGRHDHLADRRRPNVWNVALAIGRDRGMQAVERLWGIDVVRQTDLQDLDGVNRGSAANGQYQVRLCRTNRP